MLRTDALLQRIATPTLARIRKDQQGASDHVAALLAHIELHLFHPDLKVESLFSATQIKNHLIPITFHHEVGLPPRAYIEDCRLEVAARLLSTSDLKVWQIAHLVGYNSLQSFGRAFRRCIGSLPTVYRKQNAAAEPPLPAEWRKLGFLLRALRGKLAPEEAAPFMQHLESHYGSRPLGPELVIDGGALERFHADCLWTQIKDWTPEEQRSCVTSRVVFPSSALFELLLEKSRIEGRKDRARGIQLAELAVASIEGSAVYLGDAAAGLRARGWAWVGNAYRLATQFFAAEDAFTRAETVWGDVTPDPLIEAEVWHLKASLRMFQRRLDEALELQTQAILRFREANDSSLVIRSLLKLGTIAMWSGEAADSIPDLLEAREVLARHEDSYLRLATLANLATAYALVGDHQEATELLPTTKRLAAELSIAFCQHQVRWLEGLIHHARGEVDGALLAFSEAHTGFVGLDEIGHAAVISLDLAIVRVERGEIGEALSLASEALPLFEALKIHREALAALQVLRGALQKRTISLGTLKKLHATLRSLVPLLGLEDRRN